jgi:hypothetical protein
MAKVPAYHSKLDTEVYHTHSDCTVGDNIEPANVEQGTGGGRLCVQCSGKG